MAVKAGQLIHTGNDAVLLDRVQSAGPGDLNIPTEKIYELGNYESVATIRDVPDLNFSLESFDVSCEVEALLVNKDLATTDSFDLSTSVAMDIASQWKLGKETVTPFSVFNSVGLPFLTPESIGYRFGLRDNARQTIGLRGDSIYYCPGSVYVDKTVGTGAAGQSIATSHPAGVYTDAGGARRILSITVGNQRLSPGADYTITGDPAGGGYAATTVTLREAVPVTTEIRVMFFSSDVREYPQAVHETTAIKPAAVRGKDIDVYIGGYDPDDIPGSQVNKWTSVQSASVDWRVTLEKDEEFGNYSAVGQDYDVPDVTGSIELKPRDPAELFTKIRRITGVTATDEAVGANSSVVLPLDIVIKDGANAGATLKRLHVPDARFTVPGYTGRVQTKLTTSLAMTSDTGKLIVYKA